MTWHQEIKEFDGMHHGKPQVKYYIIGWHEEEKEEYDAKLNSLILWQADNIWKWHKSGNRNFDSLFEEFSKEEDKLQSQNQKPDWLLDKEGVWRKMPREMTEMPKWEIEFLTLEAAQVLLSNTKTMAARN